jgi:aspartate 1-decarboxylase
MQRTMLKSKIHRATVTDCNVNYEGSISIDLALLHWADIKPYEQVDVYNVTNGERFTTYAIEGKHNSGEICVNGAAAHKVNIGDIIIIASYVSVDEKHLEDLNRIGINWKPKVIKVDEHNIAKK